ncbi:MAG: aldehyde ferredoxin oxidoreductase [Desulfovibrionaceae bacterium]|nr:aldehyde ferredoxin oxidoreductase [Desulfovibrionaceae bacterium]
MKILRINTRTREHRFEELGKYAGLGGRALTSRLVLSEVPADCHPLAAANKLVAAAGILTGSVAANSGRISVGAKSPLTGTIKESNSGGMFAQKLARLGILAVVLEDCPPKDAPPVNICINTDGVSVTDASAYAGKGTYECMDKLRAEFGQRTCAMLIGPAGEHQRLAASIQFSDPEGRPARAAGRGGLGAVMGSKKIKAVVLDDAGCGVVSPAEPERFKDANKRWVEILKSHPVTGQGLPAYGTAILVNIINEAGALPTKNFRFGRFEFAADISGETIAETISKRGGKTKEGCHSGCVIQCSQSYLDKDGKYLTSGFEYETIWAMGANSLIKDLDDIAMLDRTCDDLGLDTIEMGNTIAVAMDGGVIAWGDGKAAIELLRKAGTKDPLGAIVGNGCRYMAEAVGVTRVPVVKGQSLPAYDPRVVKGIGVTYATSTMGADHTAGYAVAQNILKVGGDVDPHSKAGQAELSKNLQVATAAVDSLGLCLFVAFAILDNDKGVPTIAELVSSLTGKPYGVDDVVALGAATLKDEIDFNRAAGFNAHHDQLPRFFSEEPLPPHNLTWDLTEEDLRGALVK